jgi:hypothetical protein
LNLLIRDDGLSKVCTITKLNIIPLNLNPPMKSLSLATILFSVLVVNSSFSQSDGPGGKGKGEWELPNGAGGNIPLGKDPAGQVEISNNGPGDVAIWVKDPDGSYGKMEEIVPGKSLTVTLLPGGEIYMEDEIKDGGKGSGGTWAIS